MSNKVVTEPTTESGLYEEGYLHKDGGIEVTVDNTIKVEVELKEYKLCRESLKNHNKQFTFKNKTNLEILDEIFKDSNCIFETSKAKSNDFILCRAVVLDKKKHSVKGTALEIVNLLQDEKGCKMSNESSDKATEMKKGGGVSADIEDPEVIEKRWDKKKQSIEDLSNNMRSLKININKLLKEYLA